MGFPVHGTGNGDSLALTARELADRSAQLRNADIQLIKDLACLTQHIRAIKHSNNAELTAHSLTTQEDVCTGIEIVSEESYHFAGMNVQADMIYCYQASEALIEIFDL